MINSFKTVGLNTYEVIKNDIIFGILPPLKKLKLSELKIKYNTSVSTLREILSRLSGDGFVVSKEQKGFYVSEVSKSDLFEIAVPKVSIFCENSFSTTSVIIIPGGGILLNFFLKWFPIMVLPIITIAMMRKNRNIIEIVLVDLFILNLN